jgi:sialate O-acetylesterase
MKFQYIKSVFLFTAVLLQLTAAAQVKLPKLISNGMVLQHSEKLKIWGWAAPGETVKLAFESKSYTAAANAAGEWAIILPPHKPGGPHTMVFSASNEVTVNNILFGDVWLCSGQSNMELGMNRLMDTYPEEANAANDNIRQFLVPDAPVFKGEQTDVASGKWDAVSSTTIADFSGVAYFFAKALYKKYHIPVGIINSALGGSPAQAWISEEGLKKFQGYYNELQEFKDDNLIAKIKEDDKNNSASWHKELNAKDIGLKNGWKKADFDDSKWDDFTLPGYWADKETGNVNGAYWFRKTIDIPARRAGKAAKLELGRIVDADSVFVNNVFVGNTTYQYPPRKYKIEAGVLKPGKNTIVVRVINSGGKGGFVLDKPYRLILADETINLTGTWKYKQGCTMQPAKSQTFFTTKAGGLYNAMIAPLQNYTIKGALWYQGESNTGKPDEYFDLMKTLIADWRSGWGKEFPFLYVQLPGFMEEKQEPGNSHWASLRDGQAKLLSGRNTAMVVALDLGEWNDIHPVNKKDIGKRLALNAEKLVYGDKSVVASGPVLKTVKREGNKLVLTYDNVGTGLTIKGGNALKYFALAGKDEKYVWAKAEIKGKNQVIVWSESVTNPAFVSYAWADNPATANLYNKEGLPGAPFRRNIE